MPKKNEHEKRIKLILELVEIELRKTGEPIISIDLSIERDMAIKFTISEIEHYEAQDKIIIYKNVLRNGLMQ